MNLTEICAAVGIHKSKGYSILNTLQKFGLVKRSQAKTYSLGPGLLSLSSKVLDRLDVREAAIPYLQILSRKTNSTAFLGLIADNHVFVVAKDEGMQEVGVTISVGHRFPVAWGAHGKAIAAFLPESERINAFGAVKVYFHGHPSKFDRRRWEQELAECRSSGFAVDLGEMKPGINAVASPVFGPSGKVIGSLTVMGTFPKGAVNRFGSDVAAAAERLSVSMGGVPEIPAIQPGAPMGRLSWEDA